MEGIIKDLVQIIYLSSEVEPQPGFYLGRIPSQFWDIWLWNLTALVGSFPVSILFCAQPLLCMGGGGQHVGSLDLVPASALAGLEWLSGIWLAANDQWALAVMIGLAAP